MIEGRQNKKARKGASTLIVLDLKHQKTHFVLNAFQHD